MTNKTAIAVADFLKSLDNIRDVRPCQVTIGKTAYFGARYTAIEHYQPGMQAVTNGQKQVGDTSESDRFYLLMDKLPPSYTRRPKPVYVFDDKEWYVSSYFDQDEQNEQHPFGKMFMLGAWEVPNGEKIDHHDRKPRKRMPVTVEYIQDHQAVAEVGVGENQPVADAVA
jgi:hypothetical protein